MQQHIYYSKYALQFADMQIPELLNEFNSQVQNRGWSSMRAYDNGLSNCYLILKARAMGFDTLIMGMRDALRQLMSIPESETVMAVIALGYRATEPNRLSEEIWMKL